MFKKSHILFIIILLFSIPVFAESVDFDVEFEDIISGNPFSKAEQIIFGVINESSDNEKILAFSRNYLKLIQSKKSVGRLPLALKQVGNAFRQISVNDSATKYLFWALSEAKKSKDTLTYIESSIYLGLLYSRYSDWQMVRRYYNKAYEMSIAYGRPFEIASASWNMAYVESLTNNPEKSQFYGKKALDNLNKIDEKNTYLMKFGYSLAYYYYATGFEMSGRYDSAKVNYLKSIKFAEEIQNYNLLAPATVEYARTILWQGNRADFPLAVQTAKKAIEYAMKINDFIFISFGYEVLAELYEYQGKTDSAFSATKKLIIYKDSLSKYDARITAARNELELAESEYRRKEDLNNLRQNAFLGIAGITAFAIIVIFIIIYFRIKLKNKLNLQLEEANLTKDKFFSIISHDLRTPVSSIASLAGLFEKQFPNLDEADRLKYLGNIRQSSENVLKLTENLLQWAALQSKNIKPDKIYFDLEEVIQSEVLNLSETSGKKNIKLENQNSAVYVFADKNMIGVVIRNLLSNAIKYSYPDSSILIKGETTDSQAKVTIRDFGTGISAEVQNNLFRLDKRISTLGTNDEKGTGLGLNICKEFIEKNGGTIGLSSEVGKGTEIYLTLPAK